MIYIFRCKDCGCSYEKEISISEYPKGHPKFCDICGWPYPPKRVYNIPTVIYKDKDFTLYKEKDV